MKKIFSVALICLLLVSAAGCTIILPGSSAPSTGTTASAPAAGKDKPTAAKQEEPEAPAVETLAAVLSEEELSKLDEEYPELKTLDLTGSTCYDAILAYIEAHPQVDVTWKLMLTDGPADPQAEELSVSSAAAMQDLAVHAAWLPALGSIQVSASDASLYDLLNLHNVFPAAQLDFSLSWNGLTLTPAIESLDLAALSISAEDAAKVLPLLQNLQSINVLDGEGTCIISLAELKALQEAAPTAAINYPFELFGQSFTAADERLEYVNVKIGNDGIAQFREVLPYMSRLNYLKLEKCGVDSATMAKLRDDFPDIKVVWRIYFSGGTDNYNCLTDTEKIWATGTVTDGFLKELNYCTDVKYLDLGHNCITNVDFINYMPKLEVAILSITWIEDISPLANCPNLEYLECFSTHIADITPLAKCTNLQHLNISNMPRTENGVTRPPLSDISCLYELPNLKRLYCTMNNIPEEQQEEIRRRMPDCEFEFRNIDPSKGEWRYLPGCWFDNPLSAEAKANRNESYALLAQQIGYDSMDYSK